MDQNKNVLISPYFKYSLNALQRIITSILLLILRLIGIPIGAATSVILFCSGLQILSFGALCKCINFYNGSK